LLLAQKWMHNEIWLMDDASDARYANEIVSEK